jgi:hypothetical protein
VLMYNWYGPGSFEDNATKVYFDLSPLSHIINIDGGAFHSQSELTSCVAYIREHYLKHPRYEKWRGKFIITFFAKDANNASWFRAIEADNPDIVFTYNATKWGTSLMDWIDSSLENGVDNFCKTYNSRNDTLFIPCVFPGFDDTYQGHSVWNPSQPPRVWPVGVGPNWDTLLKCFDAVNRYYNVSHQLEYLQGVTCNDVEEGSNLEADFLVASATPPPAGGGSSLQLWLDGKKAELYELPSGAKTLVVEQLNEENGVVGSVTLPLK